MWLALLGLLINFYPGTLTYSLTETICKEGLVPRRKTRLESSKGTGKNKTKQKIQTQTHVMLCAIPTTGAAPGQRWGGLCAIMAGVSFLISLLSDTSPFWSASLLARGRSASVGFPRQLPHPHPWGHLPRDDKPPKKTQNLRAIYGTKTAVSWSWCIWTYISMSPGKIP